MGVVSVFPEGTARLGGREGWGSLFYAGKSSANAAVLQCPWYVAVPSRRG